MFTGGPKKENHRRRHFFRCRYSPGTDDDVVGEGGNRSRLSAVGYDLRRMMSDEILAGAESLVPFPIHAALALTSVAVRVWPRRRRRVGSSGGSNRSAIHPPEGRDLPSLRKDYGRRDGPVQTGRPGRHRAGYFLICRGLRPPPSSRPRTLAPPQRQVGG